MTILTDRIDSAEAKLDLVLVSGNTWMGVFSGDAQSSGEFNVYVGYETGKAHTGDNTTAVGYQSLLSVTASGENTGIGAHSLKNTTGCCSTAIGHNAGINATTGNNNMFLGMDSGTANSALNVTNEANKVVIGNITQDTYYFSLPTVAGGDIRTNGDILNLFQGSQTSVINFGDATATVTVPGTLSAPALTAVQNKTTDMLAYNGGTNVSEFNNTVKANKLQSLTTPSASEDVCNKLYTDTNLLVLKNGFGTNNLRLGSTALDNATGGENSGYGVGASFTSTTASDRTAVGYNSLYLDNYENCGGFGANTIVTGDNQVQLGDLNTTTYVFGTVQNRSDLRDKADVRDTVLGLEFVRMLRPVDYRWEYREDYAEYTTVKGEGDSLTIVRTERPRDGSKKRSRFHHGLIAQEVAAVISASGVDFGGFQDHLVGGGDDVKTIGYDELIAPLIRAVQQLSDRVVLLETLVSQK
jgi:hypothetical protein